MASRIDRIHSSMSKLSQRPWDEDSLIYDKMKDFEDEIDFLARFVDCISYRSNVLELAPHLGSVVSNVEASVQKIGSEILEEMNRDKWVSDLSVVSSERNATEWIELFEKFVRMMSVLKPDIAGALESLSINSVQCKISLLDFPNWENVVISTYEYVQDVQGYFVAHNRGPERRRNDRIVLGPSYLESLLGNLENDYIKDPEIEAFLTKVGSSIISAELLCCQWWFNKYNTQRGKEDIQATFQDLEQMIWLANPEFVDVIFRVLKTSKRSNPIVQLVFYHNVPFIRVFSTFNQEIYCTLGGELISLMTCVLNVPEKEDMMVNMFFSDTKQLLMETASLYYSLEDKSVAQNLVIKIWLIKIDILLRTQITDDNSIHKRYIIKSLNEIVNMIKESSDWSTGDNKIMNQILMLMEEVSKEAPMFGNSAPMVVINLLLKTLFLKGELMFLKLHDSLYSGSFKDYVQSLHVGFKLMMSSVINQPGENSKGRKTGFPIVKSVASRIISLYHQILAQNISEEMLPDLLNEIKLIMNGNKESSLIIQMPVFPHTNAVGFSNYVQSKLQELLNYEMYLVESVFNKDQISEIIELLEFFQPFLQDALEDTMSQELKDLCTRAVNLTYEAEYLIDSVISEKEADVWHSKIWLYHFLQEIRDLKIQLSKNQVRRTNKVKVQVMSRETTPEINEDVLSLVDEEKFIID